MSDVIQIFPNGRGSQGVGEDTADLLVAIETVFGVRFLRDDVVPETVGKLRELISQRLPGTNTSKCISSFTFYAVRRAMMQITGCGRQSVAPTTPLGQLLSTGAKRRREWRAIGEDLELSMPKLAFSSGVESFLVLVHFALAVAVVVFLLPRLSLSIGDRMVSVALTGFAAFVLWALARVKLQPLATQFPEDCSVGDLVKLIVARNYGSLVERSGGWSEKELWSVLRDLIADETLIEPEKITPETSFPDGLHIF